MTDTYLELSHSAWGNAFVSLLGLPKPPRLKRGEGAWSERPLDGQAGVYGAAEGGQLSPALLRALHDAGASLRVRPELTGFEAVKRAAAELNVTLTGMPVTGETVPPAQFIVYDASGLSRPERLHELYEFFQPLAARIAPNGRVVIVTRTPESASEAPRAACAASLRGFIKSLGKEIGRKGATANLIEVAPGSEAGLAGALRFLLSERAAYVSGQPLVLDAKGAAGSWAAPLKGKTALVTGAARGIGASIAEVLAREGAQVIGVDRPQEEGELAATLARFAGAGLPLDITAADAPARIAAECRSRFGGLDVIVHNAGITRDKTLRNMPPHFWDQVIEVNLAAIVRINEQLLQDGLKDGARMVCISSIGGIAGNPGQTNYGATKSGVIGYVRAMAPLMAQRGGAINAVAPGFIETAMTAQMPAVPRIMGRLLSSVMQGGLPVDIAEAVGFLASGYASGVNGQTLRVCGQHLSGG
ncbi:MAG TPA: 3-oxoacyl-ACP reductase [Candidatus Binatia bacterium]|nr:3-oxoacyl-ACP reductase [Candidatus Binatia bacterium]